MTSSSMDMGYQRANLTWPHDPLVFVNEMDINDFEKRSLILNKGNLKTWLEHKEAFDRQG